MEEFFHAGGLPIILKRLGEAGKPHKVALTVWGATVSDKVKGLCNWNKDLSLAAHMRLIAQGGVAVAKAKINDEAL